MYVLLRYTVLRDAGWHERSDNQLTTSGPSTEKLNAKLGTRRVRPYTAVNLLSLLKRSVQLQRSMALRTANESRVSHGLRVRASHTQTTPRFS